MGTIIRVWGEKDGKDNQGEKGEKVGKGRQGEMGEKVG
jgi:hypothetical protein